MYCSNFPTFMLLCPSGSFFSYFPIFCLGPSLHLYSLLSTFMPSLLYAVFPDKVLSFFMQIHLWADLSRESPVSYSSRCSCTGQSCHLSQCLPTVLPKFLRNTNQCLVLYSKVYGKLPTILSTGQPSKVPGFYCIKYLYSINKFSQ